MLSLPFGFLDICFVVLCTIRGFCVPVSWCPKPHTVGPLTNPALLLSPPRRRRLCLQRHTQVACPHPAPHLALLPPSCHCVPDKLQNNEFLADDDVALSPRSEPTPVMPGIRESAFCRLLWHLRTHIPLLPAFGEEKEGQRAALVTTNELILFREAIRKLNFTLWVKKLELREKHTFPSCLTHPADLSTKRSTRQRPHP